MLVSLTMFSSMLECVYSCMLFLQSAICMVAHTITLLTQLLPLVITSPLHNEYDRVNIGDF